MKMRIAIVDGRIPGAMSRALACRGFRVIELPPSPRLGTAVSGHPDMLISRIGGEMITTADYCELAGAEISEIFDALHEKFHFTADIHEAEYPKDGIFNALVMGKRLFARLDSLSEYLKAIAEQKGYELINTKQGYPACTALRLSDEAVITADEGMARVLSEHGIRVYKISPGGISLPPHEYGFIGGAASVHGGTVYFLGDAREHPSYPEIEAALRSEGLNAVMLGDGALLDLGGIIFAEGIDKNNA